MSATISFVIAAYNLQAYVDACIDSVIACAQPGDEIIVVNDGSIDQTGALIDAARARSPLLTTLHKANGGVASTRAAGLRQATRDYVLFLDGDDVVVPGTVMQARAVLQAQRPDILVMDYLEWQDGSDTLTPSRARSHPPGQLSLDAIRNLQETFDDCLPALWGRLIRRQLFERLPDPPFPASTMHEDLATTPHIVAVAHSQFYLPRPVVRYRVRAGSQTAERSERSCVDTVRAAAHARRAIEHLPPDAALTLQADVFMARKLLEAVHLCREVSSPRYALYAAITDQALAAMSSPRAALLQRLATSPRPQDRQVRSHLSQAMAWPHGYAALQSTLGGLKARRAARRARRGTNPAR